MDEALLPALALILDQARSPMLSDHEPEWLHKREIGDHTVYFNSMAWAKGCYRYASSVSFALCQGNQVRYKNKDMIIALFFVRSDTIFEAWLVEQPHFMAVVNCLLTDLIPLAATSTTEAENMTSEEDFELLNTCVYERVLYLRSHPQYVESSHRLCDSSGPFNYHENWESCGGNEVEVSQYHVALSLFYHAYSSYLYIISLQLFLHGRAFEQGYYTAVSTLQCSIAVGSFVNDMIVALITMEGGTDTLELWLFDKPVFTEVTRIGMDDIRHGPSYYSGRCKLVTKPKFISSDEWTVLVNSVHQYLAGRKANTARLSDINSTVSLSVIAHRVYCFVVLVYLPTCIVLGRSVVLYTYTYSYIISSNSYQGFAVKAL